MANYKVPRAVVIVDELPLNATGKVVKDALASTRGRPRSRATRMSEPSARQASRRSPACGWSSWGCGWPPRRPPRCWPTGAPTSSRSSRRPATPCATSSAPSGIGDDMPNPAFALDNRGKRSVVLDLREPRAAAHLEELLATADVFVTNLRPDALDALGLEAEATVARHPRLVYCSVSGYGLRGEDRNRPAYDIGAFWARSGLSSQLADSRGRPAQRPRRHRRPHHWAGRPGRASWPPCSSSGTPGGAGWSRSRCCAPAPTSSGWDLGLQRRWARWPGPSRVRSNQTPLMNSYRTSDGRGSSSPASRPTATSSAVCRALGRPDLLDDPRFAERGGAAPEPDRGHRRCSTRSSPSEPLGVWAERFDAEGVWWAPVQTPAEVSPIPQLRANDGILEHRRRRRASEPSVNGPSPSRTSP